MRRLVAIAAGLALGTAATMVVLATNGSSTGGFLAGPPALLDPTVPRMPQDRGLGEHLYLVYGGTFPSRVAAEAANGRLAFGDLQGFYSVPVTQFEGFRQAVADAGDGSWALVSAFRTLEGAKGFAVLAGLAGASPSIEGPFRSLGGLYAGLGQERHPDGSGPLTGPLPAGAELEEEDGP